MSNQPENENQQTQTPEEVHSQILAELEASKQAIVELSDEDLEAVSGGESYWHKTTQWFHKEFQPPSYSNPTGSTTTISLY